MQTILHRALSDMHRGLHMWRVWMALAREDIGDQHRRTALGPLWLLINYLAFAGTFVFVFTAGDKHIANYPAHVAIGLLVWFYIMEIVTQSTTLFVREENFIKGTPLPITIYILRLFMQANIRAAYTLAGCAVILLLAEVQVSPAAVWSILGLLLIVIAAPAAIGLFAFLGAYFPDTQFIVSNLMRVGMFLTPVFWSYEGSGSVQRIFYYWNPFTYFIEIVRLPIVVGHFPETAFLAAIVMTLCLWTGAVLLLGALGKRLALVL